MHFANIKIKCIQYSLSIYPFIRKSLLIYWMYRKSSKWLILWLNVKRKWDKFWVMPTDNSMKKGKVAVQTDASREANTLAIN